MKTEYLHIGLIQQSDKLGICKAGGAAALAPRIYVGGDTSAHAGIGGSSYKRLRSNLCVIPNQSEDWCGNPPRHCDRFLLKMEIATPVCALARNDREFVLPPSLRERRDTPLTSAGGKASIHPHTIWGQYAKRSFSTDN